MHVKTPIFLTLSMALAGCSGMSGDWPNLAEPFPEAAERERVVERAKPTEAPKVETESKHTRSTAYKLLESTKARINTAKAYYEAVKTMIPRTEGEDKQDHWNEAQLALTRYSHTLSRVDQIINTRGLQDAPIWNRALAFKEAHDAYLVQEREALTELTP
jgi:hypothetical protein